MIELRFFPRELWSTLDPAKKNPAWQTLPPKLQRPRQAAKPLLKCKRPVVEESDTEGEHASSDSDAVVTASRRNRENSLGASNKKQKTNNPTQRHGQKAGLEAEDDIPDVEQNEDEGDEAEDVPQDSDFSESDEDGGDDYNAEQYFDDGERDDVDDAGGDDAEYD